MTDQPKELSREVVDGVTRIVRESYYPHLVWMEVEYITDRHVFKEMTPVTFKDLILDDVQAEAWADLTHRLQTAMAIHDRGDHCCADLNQE